MTLISLVTGTWNRHKLLIQMIDSFRRNMADGIDYDIICVDGGSVDGTIEWCLQQPDVKLIQQGELLGAIRAFDAGAQASEADYVLLANDDIIFAPGSVLPAIVHLEQHPGCGAVAFMDNRPAPGYNNRDYKVQGITIIDGNGKEVQAPYPQVGLIRRSVGDLAGWWGSEDPIMSQGDTYGGDSFLGACIYELGYTVNSVDACKVRDLVADDDLRQINDRKERKKPGMYYQRFKTPPVFGSQPHKHARDGERLRILYLPIYEKRYGKYKHGLRQALQRYGLVYELDYINAQFDLEAIVKTWQPHIMVSQFHSPDGLPLPDLVQARQAKPDMLVVNWNGDVYEDKLTDPRMIAYLKHVDWQLVVNASVIPVYQAHGIPSAYWQVAYEPIDESKLPAVLRHDVVFLANAYTPERRALGAALLNMSGVNVGLYGRGWQWANGETIYNFEAGAALYRSAKIAIGDNQYLNSWGFVSNRLFEALANGVFLLQQRVDGLEDLTGYRDGVHYVSWEDSADLQAKIKKWMQPRYDKQRVEIARAGQAFTRDMHSFDRRVQELFETILVRERERA